MAGARTADELASDRAAIIRRHWLLRFSVGVALSLVLCEAMGWAPTFLAPLLVATLLGNLPFSPPLKAGLALMIVMAGAATLSFVLSSLLSELPQILVGLIAVIIFLAFAAMAHGGSPLPPLFLLLCISTIPVIAMIYPAQASFMPIAMVRGMIVAVFIVWCMFILFPEVAPPPKKKPPSAAVDSPVEKALTGTAVVMPIMLIYLLFGLADALPVLITTIILITNFHPERGAKHGAAMMVGNLVGGVVGYVVYLLLQVSPSLATLGVLTFLAWMIFAVRMQQGGPAVPIYMIACNAALVILSSSIASGGDASGILLARLFQFSIACAFAVGMMILIWGAQHPSAKPQPVETG